MIAVQMVDAIKVQFVKQIYEEDFPEKGMKAWLTDVEWDSGNESYKLYFDFGEFEAENAKYFKEVFYPNAFTRGQDGSGKKLYTAIEAGMYSPKYTVYFWVGCDKRNDELFKTAILEYLREVDNAQ